MAFLYKFCFWFSLRLGSIMIGFLTLVQAGVLLCYTIVGTNNIRNVSQVFGLIISALHVDYEFIDNLVLQPFWLLAGGAVFHIILIITTILMIIGSLQCKVVLIYPFLISYFLYIVELLIFVVIFMFYLKGTDGTLVMLIAYSNLGLFGLLFYFYTLFCVISLVQALIELEKRATTKAKNLSLTSDMLWKTKKKY